MKVFFFCYLALGVALVLTIPAILVYKIAHGTSWLKCLSLFAGYLGSFIVALLLMVRFKRFDPVWGTLFGLCFFALLFISLRL